MLKRKIIVQILIVLLIQCLSGTSTLGDLIIMTDAEQQVVGEIGYKSGVTNYLIEKQLDPNPNPQGLLSANLGVSFAHNGVTLSESLTTVFSGDQVTGNGTAFASAVWGSQPTGADDVHGGGGSIFSLYFTRESASAYFQVNGHIDIDLEDYLDLHPDEVYAYVRLSSAVGGPTTTIWEETTDGGSGDISMTFAHGLWLDAGKTYLLEAYAESGTMADLTYPDLKSRKASFSFTATSTVVPVPGAVILGSIGLSFAGWKLRKRKEL